MDKQPVLLGFHALSEPLRIQIVNLLQNGELCVSEICQELSLPQSKISFHLKTLKDSGLLMLRRQGRRAYYSLNAEQFHLLEEFLSTY
ncbi:MAG: metalloregulator ArsR/SmtB family transcription factor [Cyanobacteria bacterium P01_D01_bin.156]